MTPAVQPNTAPTISVVMPFWNCIATLEEAVESILHQTWTDFELLLLDDGCTDGSSELARSFNDPRIRIIRPGGHGGYVPLLNLGLDEARGRFVARMDADDISRPGRLRAQMTAFARDPQLGVCGTWSRRFQGRDTLGHVRPPTRADEVLCHAFFECPFVHPSVMLRKESLDRHALRYDAALAPAEDYSLWVRLLDHTRGRNIGTSLLDYRVSGSQASQTGAPRKLEVRRDIRLAQLAKLGLHPNQGMTMLHTAIFDGAWEPGCVFVEKSLAWLTKIVNANMQIGAFPRSTFSRMIALHALNLCRACATPTRIGWRLFRSSPFDQYLPAWDPSRVSFALQCLRPTRASSS